jgi:uncharacterized membrane protein
MHFLYHYLVAAGLFVIIDSFWLTTVANKFYKAQLKELLLAKPNFIPAILFYVIYMFGLVIFVINPALGQHSLNYAIAHGALLGLAMYATYDLTNHSTLKGWPAKITYLDLVWGTIITTVVGTATYLIFH